MAQINIRKSPNDDRDYRHVTLSNGLQVTLVSDPTADKAAASLDVNVGHFADPVEVPGIAHFLEHMLFLGTEDFPDENHYASFLQEHGGASNAYTSTGELLLNLCSLDYHEICFHFFNLTIYFFVLFCSRHGLFFFFLRRQKIQTTTLMFFKII